MYAGVLAAVALATFPGLLAFPLQEPDEGRYAGIAAAMARGEGWLVPHLNGIPYFEKPPLAFWLAASSLRLLGEGELAARLPSALALFGTVLLLCHWGRRAGCAASGLLAGALFAGLPLVALLGRSVIVDVPLMALTTLALYAGWRGLVEPLPEQPVERRWIWLLWLTSGLGLLTKGPVGVLVPLAGVATALVFGGARRRLAALLRPDGPLLMLLVAAPWYVAMSLASPGYAYEFFVEQNVQRFATGGRFEREGPLWSYLPLLLGALLPWSALLPRALYHGWRAGARLRRASPGDAAAPADRLAFYLFASFAVPLVVLSVAQSKRPYYVLPLLPPLALLIAPLALRVRRELALGVVALGVLCALAAVAVAALAQTDNVGLAELAARLTERSAERGSLDAQLDVVRAAAPLLGALLGVLGLTVLAAGGLSICGAWASARTALAAGMLAASALLPFALAPLAPLYSVEPISRAVDAHLRPGEIVLAYPSFLRGLPFYLGRPVLLYHASHSEFGHAVSETHARGRALQRSPQALLRTLYARDGLLVVVSGARHLEELRELAPAPLEVLHQGLKHTVVRIRPRARPAVAAQTVHGD